MRRRSLFVASKGKTARASMESWMSTNDLELGTRILPGVDLALWLQLIAAVLSSLLAVARSRAIALGPSRYERLLRARAGSRRSTATALRGRRGVGPGVRRRRPRPTAAPTRGRPRSPGSSRGEDDRDDERDDADAHRDQVTPLPASVARRAGSSAAVVTRIGSVLGAAARVQCAPRRGAGRCSRAASRSGR